MDRRKGGKSQGRSQVGSLPKLKIFTSADSLKNEFVLKSLKPDVGSLYNFLSSDFDLNDRRQAKRAKEEQNAEHQWNESLEQLKKVMNFEKKTLKQLLMNEQDQKKRQGASKLIIDQIFQQVFKTSPQQFQHRNSDQLIKERFLKYRVRKPGYATAVINDELTPDLLEFIKSEERDKAPHELTPERLLAFEKFLRQKKMKITQEARVEVEQPIARDQERAQTIQLISSAFSPWVESAQPKQKRRQLQKAKLLAPGQQILKEGQTAMQFERDEQQQKQFVDSLQKWLYYQRSWDDKRQQKLKEIRPEQCYASDYIIFIQRKKIQTMPFLETVVQTLNFERLRTVFIKDCELAGLAVSGLLVMLTTININIENLVLGGFECTEEIAGQLKRCVERSRLKVLVLDDTGMTTKMFCQIAIGLGENDSISDLKIRRTRIDNRALKAIQILLRYIKTLSLLDLSGSAISEKEARSVLAEVKDRKKKIRLL